MFIFFLLFQSDPIYIPVKIEDKLNGTDSEDSSGKGKLNGTNSEDSSGKGNVHLSKDGAVKIKMMPNK